MHDWSVYVPSGMAPVALSVTCSCGETVFIHPEPDSTPEHPRYRAQHGANPERVSPVLEGAKRSHSWRVQVHEYEHKEAGDD